MPSVAVHNEARFRFSLCLAVIALVLCLPFDSRGAQVVQYGDAVRGSVNTSFVIDLKNDDIGTIYQSATLDLEALLGTVADYISLHSSDTNFAGKSHSVIFNQCFYLPQSAPNGEVSMGWATTVNGTTLEIWHNAGDPDSDYTVWQSSAYNNGSQDTMRLYCSIPNSALNGNILTTATNMEGNVFNPSEQVGVTFHASAYPYTVITAPSGWTCTTNIVGGFTNLTITGYSGASTFLIIPDDISNMPVVAIGDWVFSNKTSLVGVAFPASLSNIGTWAFLNCYGLASLIIPPNVTNVGAYAFMNCLGLSSLVLSNGVTSLQDFAFFTCTSLTNITIPASVSHIGTAVFANNPSLQTFTVSPSNLFFSATNDILFDKSLTTLIQCPANKTSGLTIPASVVNVGGFSFGSCLSLTNMTLPNGVTNIGQYAFYDCSSLTNMVVPASVVNIGSNAFSWATRLTNIVFKGNPPAIALPVFDWDDALTVYYYPWTSGWTGSFGGRPTQVMPAYTQWLTDYGFTTSLTNDYDNDGMLNWQEFLAGTSPTNDADRLAISSMGSGTDAQITWLAKSNVSYQVRKSLDLLGAWLDAPSGAGTNQQAFQTAPADGLLQYADPDYPGATNGFYRVNVVP